MPMFNFLKRIGCSNFKNIAIMSISILELCLRKLLDKSSHLWGYTKYTSSVSEKENAENGEAQKLETCTILNGLPGGRALVSSIQFSVSIIIYCYFL